MPFTDQGYLSLLVRSGLFKEINPKVAFFLLSFTYTQVILYVNVLLLNFENCLAEFSSTILMHVPA